MGRLDRYFFQYLPDYFHLNDTYIVGEKGILERYLDSFQVETEEYVNDIEGDGSFGSGLAQLIFPTDAPSAYLNFIGDLYGNPPDTFRDAAIYRTLLSHITLINKYKGTEEGLVRFFALMGVTIELAEVVPTAAKYDTVDLKYDNSEVYDQLCSYCWKYQLNIVDPGFVLPGFNPAPAEPWALQNLFSVLLYLMPANAILYDLQYNGVSISLFLLNQAAENLLSKNGSPLMVI